MFRRLINAAKATNVFKKIRIPSQCAVCDAWPATGLVCENCVSKYAQPVARCPTCALALPAAHLSYCGACLVKRPPLDACFAAVSYTFPWTDCIARYKFGSDPAWSKILGLLMQSSSQIDAALEDADVVLPIPLSNKRLRERGYNQAHELCKQLAADKTDPHLLLRVKHTEEQSRLRRTDRLKNVATAFAIDPLRAAEVKGKQVVLVDDVMTSGSTLFAAARVLRQAQAAHITAVIFARTEIT